ncbi:DUF2804 domain-containing protein [Agromyces atrinae]|uniref:DUF2804 domain-containing protein n=1 Tax=Agromyces atrinae TaxID=592376 RepID=A0A852SK85_9MICO|nr:DUF2804 domain-containing protein [Agromyces atrinae]NYD67739.1 hypothetical protein [Agromyces atrinae]
MAEPAARVEREIVAPVDLCLRDGRLNPDAVGWTRTPLHNTDRIGRGLFAWGRNKRWDHWAITTPDHVIGVTVSAGDYGNFSQIWFLDRATLTTIDETVVSVFSRGVSLAGTLGTKPTTARSPRLEISMSEIDGGTRITAETDRLHLDVIALRPSGHEMLAVVVPWSTRLFQYAAKDVSRPVRGAIEIDGVTTRLPLGESWAMLDHGRGRWPYAMNWNWGGASGYVGARVVGLMLGGGWTVGTGMTENGVSIDGVVTKLPYELEWTYDASDLMSPWRITGPGLDIRFRPVHERSSKTSLFVVASSTHQLFGEFSGSIDVDGELIEFASLYGWTEQVHNRW